MVPALEVEIDRLAVWLTQHQYIHPLDSVAASTARPRRHRLTVTAPTREQSVGDIEASVARNELVEVIWKKGNVGTSLPASLEGWWVAKKERAERGWRWRISYTDTAGTRNMTTTTTLDPTWLASRL